MNTFFKYLLKRKDFFFLTSIMNNDNEMIILRAKGFNQFLEYFSPHFVFALLNRLSYCGYEYSESLKYIIIIIYTSQHIRYISISMKNCTEFTIEL